jgi:hypothetical protein
MDFASFSSPKFAPLEVWVAISGMSRRHVIDQLALGNIKAHKVGRSTLIDVESGLAWIRSHPAPKILHRSVRRQARKSGRRVEGEFAEARAPPG